MLVFSDASHRLSRVGISGGAHRPRFVFQCATVLGVCCGTHMVLLCPTTVLEIIQWRIEDCPWCLYYRTQAILCQIVGVVARPSRALDHCGCVILITNSSPAFDARSNARGCGDDGCGDDHAHSHTGICNGATLTVLYKEDCRAITLFKMVV